MKTSRQASGAIMVLRLALVSLTWITFVWTGCSRQFPVPGSSDPGSSEKTSSGHLPFDRVSDVHGISPTAGFAADEIPAGTEVTVRLQLALSSADSRVGDSFQAVLDEAVVVAGKTVVPRGATVTGKVVAARASRYLHDPGYLRVTLASVVVNGKAVPLRTSSIFAKGRTYGKREMLAMNRSAADDKGAVAGSAVDSGNGSEPLFHEPQISPGQDDVRFSTGRRLTFRLAQPLHLEG
jgi:hypothetical protein